MWAYFAAYQMPNDDPAGLERRVHVDYPVRIDRVLGLGELPNVRLQRAFGAPGRIQWRDKFVIWPHWLWFFGPPTPGAFILLAHPSPFPSPAGAMTPAFAPGRPASWSLPPPPP